MFLLDSLMINGISWALRTALTAAEAEMNDDSALREQLLEAEMRREMGEMSDEAFAEIERDLLARIREIKARREGGSGPLEMGAGQPIASGDDGRLQIEASVSGDFHDPAATPHTTVIEQRHDHPGLIGVAHAQSEQVLDVEPATIVRPRRKTAARTQPAAPPRARRKTPTARSVRAASRSKIR